MKKPQKMNFSPHRTLDFRTKIAAYRQEQDSICTRDMTLKVEKGIEILYNRQILKIGATYNKANKSNLFVTVFAKDSALKEIAANICTLIPANALYWHSSQNINTVIEHFNGHRCTSGFESVYHRDISVAQSGLYRDYTSTQLRLSPDGKNTCHASLPAAL